MNRVAGLARHAFITPLRGNNVVHCGGHCHIFQYGGIITRHTTVVPDSGETTGVVCARNRRGVLPLVSSLGIGYCPGRGKERCTFLDVGALHVQTAGTCCSLGLDMSYHTPLRRTVQHVRIIHLRRKPLMSRRSHCLRFDTLRHPRLRSTPTPRGLDSTPPPLTTTGMALATLCAADGLLDTESAATAEQRLVGKNPDECAVLVATTVTPYCCSCSCFGVYVGCGSAFYQPIRVVPCTAGTNAESILTKQQPHSLT